MTELGGFKFVTILVLVLQKTENEYNTRYGSLYSHPKVESIIKESENDDVFEAIYTTII